MPITGAHTILYSRDADADRKFLQEHFPLPQIDAGGGWLIFGLPPSEVAIHPSDDNDRCEFYLLCDDVRGLERSLRSKGVSCSAIEELRWGSLIRVALPGGGKLSVYQPKHARPPTRTPRKRAAAKKLSGKRGTKRKR
jgi:hypothetical protein